MYTTLSRNLAGNHRSLSGHWVNMLASTVHHASTRSFSLVYTNAQNPFGSFVVSACGSVRA